MCLNNSAEVGIIKDTKNKAVKIFSKAVGEKDDKICSLGQLLQGWNSDQDQIDENKKKDNPRDWLNQNQELKQQIMKAHAVSMLIGNRDLKDDNIMIIKKSDGSLHCAPIDFGLSCHKVSTLRWAKNKCMHFDTNNMRHENSLKFFNQDEYKSTLDEVVKSFRASETTILESIYRRTKVLTGVGFQKHQYATLIQNIQSNVREAEKICGGVAAACPNV